MEDEQEDDTQGNLQRVKISIIDFDWLFEENFDNAYKLITMFSKTNDNTKIFAQQAVQNTIEFFWHRLQPKIIYMIFIPYLALAALFMSIHEYQDVTLD